MQLTGISSMVTDQRYEGFLLVRSGEQRTDKNGNKYLDLILCDQTGEINCKVWDGNVPPPEPASVVKVRGTVQEYNGRRQFRIERIRNAVASDNVDMSKLIPCAPEKPEDMLAEIRRTIDGFACGDLRRIVRAMLERAGDPLLWFPAAQRIHHAEKSGLLHHTVGMLRMAEHMTQAYPFLNADLLKAGVIIHDLSKIDEMKSDKLGNVNDYTEDGLLIGHLVRGVAALQAAADSVGVSGELVTLLEHMVISHHGEAEYGSPRRPMFPEAEALHWLDLIDARMNEMKGVMDRVPEGAFSEKIWSLDRRVYHPRYAEALQMPPDSEPPAEAESAAAEDGIPQE